VKGETYSLCPLRSALLSEVLAGAVWDEYSDTGVDNAATDTPPSVANALCTFTSGATDEAEVIDEEGVTREGIEVGVIGPDRLMRPVVGTAGPICQLLSATYLQCHAVVSCMLNGHW
jgi:hypothetical protein